MFLKKILITVLLHDCYNLIDVNLGVLLVKDIAAWILYLPHASYSAISRGGAFVFFASQS